MCKVSNCCGHVKFSVTEWGKGWSVLGYQIRDCATNDVVETWFDEPRRSAVGADSASWTEGDVEVAFEVMFTNTGDSFRYDGCEWK